MTLEQACKDFIIKRVYVDYKVFSEDDMGELEKYRDAEGKVFLDLDYPNMNVSKFGFGFRVTAKE